MIFGLHCCTTLVLWENHMAGNNETHLVLQVKCPILLSDINRNLMSRQMSIKVSNIRFYENPSSGSRPATCVQAEGNDEVNRRFSRLYADAPKNKFVCFFVPSLNCRMPR